jgi:AcrR family transcriptional regulator
VVRIGFFGPREIDPEPGGTERSRIRRALLDASAERGYQNLTLPTLLEWAEVDGVAFHRHFSDLEDCFCEVVQEESTRLLFESWRAFSDQQGWADQVRSVAYTLLRFFQEDDPRARLMLIEVDTAGERARLIRDQGLHAFITFIDLGRHELDDPSSITRATAEAIGGSILSQLRHEVECGDEETQGQLLPQLMYAVVLPYLGPEAAARELYLRPPAPATPVA